MGAADQRIQVDIAVVGSGPAGHRAALECAREGRRTVVIDRRNRKVGGVSLHVGTIPSKTLREAVLYLKGFRHKHIYGDDYAVRGRISLEDLTARVDAILSQELSILEAQFLAAGVGTVYGEASFTDSHTLRVYNRFTGAQTEVVADRIILAPGTVPRHPDDVPFDHEVIFDSNFIFSHKSRLSRLPESLVVVGGGVIGTEYAAMFAALGCRVTLVDRNERVLPYLDGDISGVLLSEMARMGVELMLGRGYREIGRIADGTGYVVTDRGERVTAEAVLFSLGRVPCVKPLQLAQAGVKLGERDIIPVDTCFRTNVPHIYAAGDVIGPPALASIASEQGRVAARQAMGYTVRDHRPDLFPFAIYSIPETALIGKTEEQLQEEGISYVSGVARYAEVSKATIKGGSVGMLKLLFAPESWKLLGVHVVGDQAAELVHIGQVVMTLGGRLDYFVHNVFNYPTWAEAYRVAALDGMAKLNVPSRIPPTDPGAPPADTPEIS